MLARRPPRGHCSTVPKQEFGNEERGVPQQEFGNERCDPRSWFFAGILHRCWLIDPLADCVLCLLSNQRAMERSLRARRTAPSGGPATDKHLPCAHSGRHIRASVVRLSAAVAG